MHTIEELETRNGAIATRLGELTAIDENESRSLTDEENTELDTLLEEHRSNLAEIQTQRQQRERLERAAQIADQFTGPVQTFEQSPYERGNGQSFFRDMFSVAQSFGLDRAAADRLIRNTKHVADAGKRFESRDERHQREVRAMSTTTSAGGTFAPPLWEIDQFVKYLRPDRITADLLTKQELPSGVSSINLPSVTQGALTGAQATQNTAIATRDFTTGSVSTGINTVAGGVTISQQLIDQTPINLDDVILQDMAADYAMQIDTATIAALVGVSGINAVPYTDASPTSLKLLPYVQQAIDDIQTNVYRPATAIVMRPDRWGRFLAAADSSNRPLVIPKASYGAFNVVGESNGQVPQGLAGTLRGVPVYLDAVIPNNLGTGTNQDEIIVLRGEESYLYESTPQLQSFQQTFANQLSLFVRFYAYYGIVANRYPKAISVISGTGLVPPAYGA